MPEISLTKDLSLQLYASAQNFDIDAARKLGLVIPFDVVLQDPSILESNPDLASDDTFGVRWEPGITDGPTSARFVILDRDDTTGEIRPAATWDADQRQFVKGDQVLGTDNLDEFEFHQVNVWALLQSALAFYESPFGLGRRIPWGFEGNRLTVIPHAKKGKRAFYQRSTKSLRFYWFDSGDTRVYTCLSADIVYHEFAHAVLDGVRPYYVESTSLETLAFHEYMGDISAILMSLRNKTFRQTIADQTLGNLASATNLSSIAEQFGQKTTGRQFLRSAINGRKMSNVATSTNKYAVSKVLTGTMYEILLAMTKQYLEREQSAFDSGASTRKPSAPRVFWNAIQAMQRIVVSPLDLLPPVDVTFRDYARAVLRSLQLSDPLDPNEYFELLFDIFVKREILDEGDRAELTGHRYLFERARLKVFHDIDDISRSRSAAYRFLHDNREELYIPLSVDVIVCDLYDTNRVNGAGLRMPRQIVVQYVWKEDLPAAADAPGDDEVASEPVQLLCGGTLVFNDYGNVLSWVRKPGAMLERDEVALGWPDRVDSKIKTAWYGEVEAGKARRQHLIDRLA